MDSGCAILLSFGENAFAKSASTALEDVLLLNPGADQVLFRDTTASFLDVESTPNAVRARRGDPVGHSVEYWRQGTELGWTSLLTHERHGGGAIGDHGLVDLTLVAHEFGRHAAPGPLVPTNVVAALLSHRGDGVDDAVAALMAGESTAAWCFAEPPPHDRIGDIGLTIVEDGDDLVIDGIKRPIEAAGSADWLLVTGRTGDGITNVLVPASAPGITIRPLTSTDLTRRFATVEFRGVRVARTSVVGTIGGGADDAEWGLRLALALVAAETVGAMQTAFDMTVEWAFDRYSFGRPLASYQALKHRFADMKSWLEASHAIADAAALAVAEGRADAPDLTSAALAYIGEHGARLGHECVQIHGGIGVTFEHDLHLSLRRIVVNRTAYGSPGDHRRRLADLLEQQSDLEEVAS